MIYIVGIIERSIPSYRWYFEDVVDACRQLRDISVLFDETDVQPFFLKVPIVERNKTISYLLKNYSV